MRRLFLPLLAIAAFAASTPALASEDTQYWQTLQVGVQLPDNFKLSSETVFRTSDAKGFYEIEENIMAGYKLDKHVTLWLGYTHDPQFSHGNFTGLEHRIRQQVTIDNFALIGKVKLSGRVRLEERFRDGIAGTGWRLRPYIKASVPFIGKSTVSVTHESFLDLNTTSFQKVGGYERMRNAISVGVPLNKKISIDFGYLNQHGFVRNGPDTSDNVLTTGLSASF
jgi:hypothetical protein